MLQKKQKYSGKFSLPNISTLHPHSLALRISVKLCHGSWWPFSCWDSGSPYSSARTHSPSPRGFTKTTPLPGSQEGQQPWHHRWLPTHLHASLLGGRSWLTTLCSLLDNTNSMGHWPLSISIMDQSQFGFFDREESELHRHELLMDYLTSKPDVSPWPILFSSMDLASMGWEKQKIISHSEVWNEGIRRQICRYIKHVKVFKCCKKEIRLCQGFSGPDEILQICIRAGTLNHV